MTPNAPVIDRPPEEETRPPLPPMTRPAQQQVPPPMPPPSPYSWQPPMAPVQPQIIRFEPTAAQRLSLAIVSLVLLIPLCAIAAGSAVPLADTMPGWLAAAMTLLAQLIVCIAVVGVNIAYNADALRTTRPR